MGIMSKGPVESWACVKINITKAKKKAIKKSAYLAAKIFFVNINLHGLTSWLLIPSDAGYWHEPKNIEHTRLPAPEAQLMAGRQRPASSFCSIAC